MKIIIDIPECFYEYCKAQEDATEIQLAVKNGTPLPKGHGDLIDKEKLKENINNWYAFMKDVCKQPYMTLKQEEIIGKIDMMKTIIKADKAEK